MVPITLTIYMPDDVGFLRTSVNKWEIASHLTFTYGARMVRSSNKLLTKARLTLVRQATSYLNVKKMTGMKVKEL